MNAIICKVEAGKKMKRTEFMHFYVLLVDAITHSDTLSDIFTTRNIFTTRILDPW